MYNINSSSILTNLSNCLRENPGYSYEELYTYLKKNDYFDCDPLSELSLDEIKNSVTSDQFKNRGRDKSAEQQIESYLQTITAIPPGSFQAYQASPDNNCFFNSFSFLLNGSEDWATDLRWAIIREFLTDLEHYQSISLTTAWNEEGELAPRSLLTLWVADKRNWSGGIIECYILAKLFNRSIAVLDLKNSKIDYQKPETFEKNQKSEKIFWVAFVNGNHYVPVLATDEAIEKKLLSQIEVIPDERKLLTEELAAYTIEDANNFVEIKKRGQGNYFYNQLLKTVGRENYVDLVEFAFGLAELTNHSGLIFSLADKSDWVSIKNAALNLKLASLSVEEYRKHPQKEKVSSPFTWTDIAYFLGTFFNYEGVARKLKSREEIEKYYIKKKKKKMEEQLNISRFLAKLEELRKSPILVSTLGEKSDLKAKLTKRVDDILNELKKFQNWAILKQEWAERKKNPVFLDVLEGWLSNDYWEYIDGTESQSSNVKLKDDIERVIRDLRSSYTIKIKAGASEEKKSQLLKSEEWQNLYLRYGCEKEEKNLIFTRNLFYREIWEDYLLPCPAKDNWEKWEKEFWQVGASLVEELKKEKFIISNRKGQEFNLAKILAVRLERFFFSFIGEFGFPPTHPAVKVIAAKISRKNQAYFGCKGEQSFVQKLVSDAWRTIHFYFYIRQPAFQPVFFACQPGKTSCYKQLEIWEWDNENEEEHPPFIQIHPGFSHSEGTTFVPGKAVITKFVPTLVAIAFEPERTINKDEHAWQLYRTEIKEYLGLFRKNKEQLDKIKTLYRVEFNDQEWEWKLSLRGEKLDLLTEELQKKWAEFEAGDLAISVKASAGQCLIALMKGSEANDSESPNCVVSVIKELKGLLNSLEGIKRKSSTSSENLTECQELIKFYSLNCDLFNMNKMERAHLLCYLFRRKIMDELVDKKKYPIADFPGMGKENLLIRTTSQLINQTFSLSPIIEAWKLQLAQKIYGPMTKKLYQPASPKVKEKAQRLYDLLAKHCTIEGENEERERKKLASIVSQTWRFFYLRTKSLALDWEFCDGKLVKDVEKLIEERRIEMSDRESEEIGERKIALHASLLCWFPAVFYSTKKELLSPAQMKLIMPNSTAIIEKPLNPQQRKNQIYSIILTILIISLVRLGRLVSKLKGQKNISAKKMKRVFRE